jgi:hypothetical protein
MNKNQLKMPNQDVLNKINLDSVKFMQVKYPAAEIELKDGLLLYQSRNGYCSGVENE